MGWRREGGTAAIYKAICRLDDARIDTWGLAAEVTWGGRTDGVMNFLSDLESLYLFGCVLEILRRAATSCC